MCVSMEIRIILIDSRWTPMCQKHVVTEENVSITRSPSERRELIDDLNLADALRGAAGNEAVLITAICSTYLTRLDPGAIPVIPQ